MMLRIEHLSKAFPSEKLFSDLNFSVAEHQTFSIVGRSGCGKTTLLKIIAGLLPCDGGNIVLHERTVNDIPAHKRNIVYLYQETLLFPHLNVFENIAFGLRLRGSSEDLIRTKTEEMIRSLGLQEHRIKMPQQLSGGQKQRVSFGRALIVNPLLLLLDEPFGNLDADTRINMQEFFRDVAKQFQITSIFVTHDLKEAILMGDCIGWMRDGTLTTFSDKQQFINDPQTGVRREIEFWKSLKRKDE